uniref:STAS domain-containing protein n=1 Tax=Esox lucius TaxID=8010 RepID=A0AAY5KWY3_ESOLU
MGVQEPGSSEFYVDRNVLNEISLDEVARKRTFSIKPPLKERVKDSLRCSVPKLKRSVLGFLPVLSWLPRYSLRDNALGDLTSGISVGIMHLPMGLAYSLLAGTPPVYGLYTSFYPVLVYIIFGTSKHISMGTFAVTSLMVGTVTQTLAPNSNYMTLNGTNGTAVLDSTALYNDRVQIASSLTVLCGIFQFAMGLLQVGFIATYLSDPLVRGYTTGAGIQVVLSQLSSTFGISTSLYTGPLSQVYVIGTIISYYANLNGLYKVAVVGQIPRGLLAPRNPDISLWGSVAGSAFALAIVGYAISISLGKTFGLKHGYKVDSNQELIALGACNLVGGFFQCHFVTPALSRSLLQETTGGKTQMVGLVSSVFMLIIILEIGTLFQQLPKAVLACIVYVNLKGIFVQFWDIPALWKSNKVDLMVWLVTLVCTILLNLDMGLAVAVAFSIITVIVRSQLPNYYILGRVPGTEIYLDIDAYEEVKEIPGVIIFRSSTTMYYTNAELYLDALQKKSGIDTGKLITQKKKREAEEKRQAKTEENKAKKEAKKLVNWAFEKSSEAGFPGDDLKTQKSSTNGDGEMGSSHNKHTLILDLSTASFVDTVTLKTLRNIFKDFKEIGIATYLTGCQGEFCVVEQLSIAGFFCESIPKSCLFATVHDAVLHSLRVHGDKDIILYDYVSCHSSMLPFVVLQSTPNQLI